MKLPLWNLEHPGTLKSWSLATLPIFCQTGKPFVWPRWRESMPDAVETPLGACQCGKSMGVLLVWRPLENHFENVGNLPVIFLIEKMGEKPTICQVAIKTCGAYRLYNWSLLKLSSAAPCSKSPVGVHFPKSACWGHAAALSRSLRPHFPEACSVADSWGVVMLLRHT